jgi:hypothetical protein
MPGQGQLITGVVVGAGAMYLLDPDRGSRRRGLLQEKSSELGRQLSDRFPAVGAQDPERWSPRTRLILGATGGLMAVKGLRTRGIGGEILTALGTALLSRAVSGTPPQALVDLVSDGSSATPSARLPEHEAPAATEPVQEEAMAAHATHHRRTTKSTKRQRSRE